MEKYQVIFTAQFYHDAPHEQLARDIYQKLQLIPSISRYVNKSHCLSQPESHPTEMTFLVSAHYEGKIKSNQKFIDCYQLFANVHHSGYPCEIDFWDSHLHAYVPYCGPPLFDESRPDSTLLHLIEARNSL